MAKPTNRWRSRSCTRQRARLHARRVTGKVVGQVGAGHSVEEILTDYPYLEREDVMQAIRYAAWRAEEREVMLGNA